MAKIIPLTRGYFTLVHEADYAWLSRWKWHLSSCGYAVRNAKDSDGRRRTISMHRAILGLRWGDKRQVDHWDNDRLNNVRGSAQAR